MSALSTFHKSSIFFFIINITRLRSSVHCMVRIVPYIIIVSVSAYRMCNVRVFFFTFFFCLAFLSLHFRQVFLFFYCASSASRCFSDFSFFTPQAYCEHCVSVRYMETCRYLYWNWILDVVGKGEKTGVNFCIGRQTPIGQLLSRVRETPIRFHCWLYL